MKNKKLSIKAILVIFGAMLFITLASLLFGILLLIENYKDSAMILLVITVLSLVTTFAISDKLAERVLSKITEIESERDELQKDLCKSELEHVIIEEAFKKKEDEIKANKKEEELESNEVLKFINYVRMNIHALK